MSKTSAALFAFFAALFLLFASNYFTAVDGAVRCVDIFWNRAITFHANHHLLYPVWVLLWANLTAAVGIVASNAFEFIRITEAMNGLLAAASIALLYSILREVTTPRIALLCALVFGFSTAVVRHATNSAEPIPGLFCSLLGIRLMMTGIRRDSPVVLFASGIAFAFALASYQAMGTIAGPGALICITWPAVGPAPQLELRTAARRLLFVIIGGLAGIVGLYGFAYSYQHVPVGHMLIRFFSLTAPDAYAGFSVSRIVNVPFGLARSLFEGLPGDYRGIRSLAQHPSRAFWIPAVIVELVTLGLIAALAAKALLAMARRSERLAVIVGCLALLLLAFPLLYWDPVYDKLWLLPLAGAVSIIAISLRPGALAEGSRKLLAGLMVAVLAVQLGVNIPRMIQNHRAETPHAAQAQELDRFVARRDWVMLDFDEVSNLWMAIWGHDRHYLVLPSSNTGEARDWLNAAKQECAQHGANIFFVGVLDQDQRTWDAFLGRRVGIPFDSLEEYRAKARVVARYDSPASSVTVREYAACR